MGLAAEGEDPAGSTGWVTGPDDLLKTQNSTLEQIPAPPASVHLPFQCRFATCLFHLLQKGLNLCREKCRGQLAVRLHAVPRASWPLSPRINVPQKRNVALQLHSLPRAASRLLRTSGPKPPWGDEDPKRHAAQGRPSQERMDQDPQADPHSFQAHDGMISGKGLWVGDPVTLIWPG